MRKVLTGLLILTVYLFPNFSNAQNHWETGLTLGYTNYLGDLVVPVFTVQDPHLGLQGYLRKNFDANHAYRLNFLYGKISGSDANYEELAGRGVSFENVIFEISSMAEIDLLGKKRYPRKGQFNKKITPYLLLGIGFLHGKANVTYSILENEDALQDYPSWHVSVPIGAGMKMDLREDVFIGLEVINRATLSDNLDGVQLTGNAYRNDAVFMVGLNVGYRFVKNPNGVEMTIEGESPEKEDKASKKQPNLKRKKNQKRRKTKRIIKIKKEIGN